MLKAVLLHDIPPLPLPVHGRCPGDIRTYSFGITGRTADANLPCVFPELELTPLSVFPVFTGKGRLHILRAIKQLCCPRTRSSEVVDQGASRRTVHARHEMKSACSSVILGEFKWMGQYIAAVDMSDSGITKGNTEALRAPLTLMSRLLGFSSD